MGSKHSCLQMRDLPQQGQGVNQQVAQCVSSSWPYSNRKIPFKVRGFNSKIHNFVNISTEVNTHGTYAKNNMDNSTTGLRHFL